MIRADHVSVFVGGNDFALWAIKSDCYDRQILFRRASEFNPTDRFYLHESRTTEKAGGRRSRGFLDEGYGPVIIFVISLLDNRYTITIIVLYLIVQR